jgi:hypothetical protein
VWPQCWDLQGARGLEQRDLRNLNLGDLKKGPNGGISPTPQEKSVKRTVKFTMEVEATDTLLFLDVLAMKRGPKLVTKVYQKPNTRRYLYFESNHPHHVKMGVFIV